MPTCPMKMERRWTGSRFTNTATTDAEHPFKYAFFSFFREDPKTVFKELKRKDPREAFWGVLELTLFVTTFVILGILNWRYICFLLPFYYFGHSLSYLNGYYRHYGGNPDEPLAWGVSSYDKLYNWTWFFKGLPFRKPSSRRKSFRRAWDPSDLNLGGKRAPRVLG